MNKRMTTNCPNCGGELTSDGYCNYCNTKVRYANEMIVDLENSLVDKDVEIMISVKNGNKVTLIPFKGVVEEFTQHYDTWNLYADGRSYPFRNNNPRISIRFSGYAQEVSETVVNETVKGVRDNDS